MRSTRPLSGRRTIELRSVFSPLALVTFLFVPVLLLYTVSSASIFATEFDSRKTLTATGLIYFALALLLFAAGAQAGDTSIRRRTPEARGAADVEPSESRRRSLTTLLEAALLVAIGAYLLWFGIGIVRAGGPLELLEIWRTAPHLVKAETLATLPGVTTLTQLSVAAIPLAVAYRFAGRGTAIRGLTIAVLLLAAIRSVIFSERLAIIELVVPLLFLLAVPRRITVPRVAVYATGFLAAALVLFSATELRRTYVYTSDFSPTRSATRFFGYYLTSVNNGMAIVDAYPARTPAYWSGTIFWDFPVLGDLRAEHLPAIGTVSFRYEDAFGIDPPAFLPQAFAAQGLDLEFNVLTVPGYLAADFGWAGLVAVFLIGIVSGRLYRRTSTSAFHAALYGVWLVGLLEFMRILYATDPRVFPAYLVFVAAWLVLRRPAPVRRVSGASAVPGGRRLGEARSGTPPWPPPN